MILSDGSATGRTKTRKDVHRDGDWHRSIHVWVYGVEENRPFLLMNRRGLEKDTWPGVLDATVGGHLGAGESVADAYREVDEEIGIVPDPDNLRWIGTRLCSAEHFPSVIDRELQETFLLRDDRRLGDFRPNPAELEGIVRIDLADALHLFSAERDTVSGTFLSAHDRSIAPITVREADLLPVRIDQYFLRVAIAIDRTLRGEKYIIL